MPAETPERGAVRWLVRGAAVAAAVAFLALLAYGLFTKDPNTTIDDSLADARATPAPNFTLDVLQRGTDIHSPILKRAFADGRVSLRELRGAPVVLNFWASWCIPCRDEAADLERLWKAGGLIMLGLDQQDITDDARDFIREFGLTYPMVREGGDGTAHRYGTTGIPETYFISAQGKVVGHVIGAVSPAQLRSGLAAARAGRPIGVREGGSRKKT